jgi:hypothetical protein
VESRRLLRILMSDWLLRVGVLVSHVTAAVTTMRTAMVSSPTPTAHAHAAHIGIWLHCSAAVGILSSQDNTAKAD